MGSYNDAPIQDDEIDEPDNIDGADGTNIVDDDTPVAVDKDTPQRITTKFLTKYERGTSCISNSLFCNTIFLLRVCD